MLVWLNGNQNIKQKPNENYARELMELFTLGANRGAYTETDVREQARALTGWQGNVVNRQSTGFTLRRDPPRHRASKTIFGKTGNYSLAGRVPALPRPPGCTRRSSSRSSGATSSRRSPTRRRRRRSQERYAGRQVRPVVEAILLHPDFYNGPRMAKPPVVFNAGPAADARPLRSTRRPGGRSASRRASSSSTRRTSAAGTTRAGSTRRRSARAGSSPRSRRTRSTPTGQPERSGAAPRPRARVLGLAHDHADDAGPAAGVRGGAAQAQDRRRRRRDRAAPADRLLPRPPDGMSCYDCNRSEQLPPRGGAAGEGLPEIEPGMPLPAGTGHVAAQLPLALGRARARRLRRRARSSARARRRDRRGRGRRAREPEGARLDLPERRHRRAQRPLPGRRPALLRAAADDRASAQTAGHAVPRGRPAALASGGRRRSRRCTPRARSRCCRRSATTTPTSRTSPRATTTRSAQTDAHLRTGWLGRYLDRVGTPDNPVQGLTLDTTLHPALATAKVPVATLLGADQYRFAAPGIAPHPLEASMLQMAANIGAAHAKSTDPGLKQAGQTALRLAPPLLPARQLQVRLQQPGRLPELDRSVPEPARRARRDARRRDAGARRRR